jgi:hypothetical protein
VTLHSASLTLQGLCVAQTPSSERSESVPWLCPLLSMWPSSSLLTSTSTVYSSVK